MNNSLLPDYIRKISRRIPEEDIPLLVSCAKSRELKKGEVLLKEGDVCREFYFVVKGYLKTYYNKDEISINLNFAFERDFTTNIRSINGRRPSELIIEAGEDASVLVFNMDNINTEFNAHPQIILFIRRLSVHILLASEEHSNYFKTHTPTERYLYLEQNNPRILQRISLSQIASYLGVTRETLSRIRGKRN